MAKKLVSLTAIALKEKFLVGAVPRRVEAERGEPRRGLPVRADLHADRRQNNGLTPAAGCPVSVTINYLGDDPVDDPRVYEKTSPISYIKKAKTPTLIQQGELDKRLPIANARELRQG